MKVLLLDTELPGSLAALQRCIYEPTDQSDSPVPRKVVILSGPDGVAMLRQASSGKVTITEPLDGERVDINELREHIEFQRSRPPSAEDMALLVPTEAYVALGGLGGSLVTIGEYDGQRVTPEHVLRTPDGEWERAA